MPLTGHLGELRKRVVRILCAVAAGFGVSFFFSERIVDLMTRPIRTSLIFTAPTEPLWSNLKVALFSGLLLSLPVILHQVYQFIAPGLYPRERKNVLPFIAVGTFFFLLGISFCYFVVLPLALKFLMHYKTGSLVPMISIGVYVDFILKFMLAFGLIFELPVVIIFLARLGLLTPDFLSRNRKYAVLINFILAAVLTPTPDIFNQCLMAGPLILLYEVGIIGARWFGKKRVAENF